MHIVLAFLGVLAGFGYWFFVLKNAGQAAGEIADLAGKAKGVYRRNQFRKKADRATIDAIDDPRLAATVMAVALVTSEADITPAQEAVLKSEMKNVMGVDSPDEDLVFAKWAAKDVVDPNNLSMRLSKVWTASLDMDERQQLLDLIVKVATTGRDLSDVQQEAVQRLKGRLALTA